MEFPVDQIQELKKIYPNASRASDGGVIYFPILGLRLPAGCVPEVADVLLCPTSRDGYDSRLFFSQVVTGSKVPNWNKHNERILERNWFAYSYKVPRDLRLAQLVAAHLGGIR